MRLYFKISSEFYAQIKKEAQEKEMSIAQLCRQKLKISDKLDRIELILERLLKLKENEA